MTTLFPSTPIDEVYSPSGFLSVQEEEPLSLGKLFETTAKQAQIDSPMVSIFRMHDISMISQIAKGTETYDPQKANELYGKYGLNFNEPITKIEADYMARQKMDELYAQEAMSRHEGDFASGAASFGGAIFGSLMDPVNIAASAIPITRAFPGLKAMHASASALDKLKFGFIDAAIGNAIVEPLAIGAATMDQRDYTVTDSMMNIFIGGLIGVGITGLGEGLKYVSKGNKFNALATGLKEYSNSEVPTAMNGIIDTSPQVSKFTVDDLVVIHDDVVNITKSEAGEVQVQLKDDGILGQLIGVGNSLDAAKADLRQQYGLLLDNDVLIRGYDVGTVTKKIETALFDKFPGIELKDIQKILYDLGAKDDIIDFIYHETNGLKDLDSYIKNLRIKEGAKIKTTLTRIGKALEDKIDDKVQEVAIRREARKLIMQGSKRGSVKELLREARRIEKDLYTPETRQLMYDELLASRDRAATAVEDLQAQMRQLEADFAAKQKQLDNTNKLARQNKLKDEIADLNRAINALQNDINSAINLSRLDPEMTLRTRQDRVGAIKSVLEALNKDARTTTDIRNILEGKKRPRHELDQPETVKELDDYFSQIKDEMEIENAEVSKLSNDVQKQIEGLKEDNIYAKIGDSLEKEMEDIDEEYNKFSKDLKNDYKNYLDCRSTEGIS